MTVPKIIERRTIAASRFFTIEELDLKFANGVIGHFDVCNGVSCRLQYARYTKIQLLGTGFPQRLLATGYPLFILLSPYS